MTAPRDVANTTAETRITEVSAGAPGWLLRVLVALAGLGAVAAQAGSGLELVFLIVLGLFAVLVAAAPATPAPAMLIVAVAVVAALSGPDPLRPAVLLAVPLLHLVHLGSALSAIVPVRSRIHPRALLRPALRFVVVQAATFAIAGLFAVLPTSANGLLAEVLALLGTAVLVLLALRLLWPPGSGRADR